MATNQIAAFTYPLKFAFSILAGDKNGEGAAYGNIGICFKELGDFEKAIEYAKKDLEIARQTGE